MNSLDKLEKDQYWKSVHGQNEGEREGGKVVAEKQKHII